MSEQEALNFLYMGVGVFVTLLAWVGAYAIVHLVCKSDRDYRGDKHW